jgi:hypothetical protein
VQWLILVQGKRLLLVKLLIAQLLLVKLLIARGNASRTADKHATAAAARASEPDCPLRSDKKTAARAAKEHFPLLHLL